MPAQPFRQLPFEPRPVPRLRAPAVEALAKRRFDGPLVLEGCLDGWPLLRALRERPTRTDKLAVLDRLTEGASVLYAEAPPGSDGHFGLDDALDGPSFELDASGEVPFAELTRRLATTDDVIYMQGAPAGEALCEALGGLAYLDRADVLYEGREVLAESGYNLWLGSGGHVVNLHYDPGYNFIGQLEGRKRVTLFPPAALPHLYPQALDRRVAGVPVSLVRLLDWDAARFPRLGGAFPLGVGATLEPGDVLYIPPLWWHHVESQGLNVMVNAWVETAPWDAMAEGIERAVALFHAAPEAGRRAAAAALREALGSGWSEQRFADARATLGGGRLAADAATHLHATCRLAAPHEPPWGEYLATAYDVHVFRLYGDPLAAVPGAYDAWAARCRAAIT